MILDIEDYRRQQLNDYTRSLVDVIELIKCDACGYEVDEKEITYCTIPDVKETKGNYCHDCIEAYREENL